ncbi:MAG: LysM peptidoglycan-binding domain-containing protein, partial [Gammaproteobacteria bacterium]|nr:LysM peptidoglycan-binding domain-containing protein [Gammaproteobacteria bacterium]
MSKYRKIVVAFFFILSSQDVIAELQGKYWIVNSGDTLYGIARSIFPGNASLQSKLRIEIINLNQKVFKKGSGSLYIGAELVLPEFALSQLPPVQSSQIKSHSKVSRKPKTTTSQKTSSHFLLENNEWQVKRGDTLYSIARVFYPKSSRTQYKLRKDIVNLNPAIFSGGMNNMEIGLVLLMPDYVVKADEPVNEIVAVPLEAEPLVIDTPVEVKVDKSISEPVSEKEIHASEIEADREPDIEPVSVSEKPDKHYGVTNYNNKQFSSQVSMNFGYSSGGDIAVAATGGSDVEFGGGGHLRLSYDGLWQNKQGYRLSLGYELGQVTAGSDSGELEQTY